MTLTSNNPINCSLTVPGHVRATEITKRTRAASIPLSSFGQKTEKIWKDNSRENNYNRIS